MRKRNRLGQIVDLIENEKIFVALPRFVRGRRRRFDHRRRLTRLLHLFYEPKRQKFAFVSSLSCIVDFAPVPKSMLSNEIFIINLCLALSMYCFPDGEFLNGVERSGEGEEEEEGNGGHDQRVVGFLRQGCRSSLTTGDENEIVEEKETSILLQARRRLQRDQIVPNVIPIGLDQLNRKGRVSERRGEKRNVTSLRFSIISWTMSSD